MQIDADEAMRLLGMQVYLNSQLSRQLAVTQAALAEAKKAAQEPVVEQAKHPQRGPDLLMVAKPVEQAEQ